MTVRAPTFENDLSPAIRHVAGNEWELVESWTYTWKQGGDWYRIEVPSSYSFEPSIHRSLWPIVSPMEALIASCLHDYSYGEKPTVERWRVWPQPAEWTQDHQVTRKEADRLFLRIMGQRGQSWWRRGLAYVWVRAGGWLWWNDYFESIDSTAMKKIVFGILGALVAAVFIMYAGGALTEYGLVDWWTIPEWGGKALLVVFAILVGAFIRDVA